MELTLKVFLHCSGGGSKVDEAIELYLQAANKFKMAKQWSKAGGAFTEAATHYQKNDSKLDAGTNFVEAGNCYKKTDPNRKNKYSRV